MDTSQRIKEETEAKLKMDMDEANRDDEVKNANNIAERTRRNHEVGSCVSIQLKVRGQKLLPHSRSVTSMRKRWI